MHPILNSLILFCMKKVILCGLNARYTHSNLALLCLKHSVPINDNIHILELSINDRISEIVNRIVSGQPDAIGFSCYIWNIELILKAASTVKKILPNCFIFLGGPEVSFSSEALMTKNSFIDMILKGEGEISFKHFIECFNNGLPLLGIPSACIREKDDIVTTQDEPLFDMAELPFLYQDLALYKNKTLYYETSRGCPYRCAYCMSANEKMRFLPLDRVFSELEYFLKADVQQVKLVDRTFNYPKQRAYDIFKTLIELSKKYPKSRTNFHFEISACLLDDEMLKLLSKAPKDLIQLEIGIQTTHAPTLKAINRNHDTKKLFNSTKLLCDMPNIHVHVDLIAGLPHEDYATFAKSFNDVYSLGAQQFQLGFLKLLKGSPMHDMAEEYSIKYTDYAPYEVLSTHVLSCDELSVLHRIGHVVDTMVNTGRFSKTLAQLVPRFNTSFEFFEQITEYLENCEFFKRPQKKQSLFEILYRFSLNYVEEDINIIKEALTYDWLCMEKPRNWPKGLEVYHTEAEKQQIRKLYKDTEFVARYLPKYQHLSGGEISKRCFIVRFNYLLKKTTWMLFDYGHKRGEEGFIQTIVYDVDN